MSGITVFQAAKVVTLDRNRPEATHVAVRDGRILAVGGPDCAVPWGGGTPDDRLKDAVVYPGFVEGHAHMMAGPVWSKTYIGYHDRIDPDGGFWPGVTSVDLAIARLREAAARLPEGEPLSAWGFDPIFFDAKRLDRRDLDQVATDRMVVVQHSNGHVLTCNSYALAEVGYDQGTNIEGVVMDAEGPNGELQEMAAMFPVQRRAGLRDLRVGPDAAREYAKVAMRAGVTTATDLFAAMQEADADALAEVCGDPGHCLRIVPALNAMQGSPTDVRDLALALRARSTDMLRLGAVKLMTDGSIQGYSARIKWPGYVTGAPNGIWNMAPDLIFETVDVLHAAGVQMHVHTNGDEASEVVIDAIEAAVARHGLGDHRHVLQHGQMIGESQFRRMAALGIAANLFANHLWYFGDQHAAKTIGEDRAMRMDACRAALDAGVLMSIHSDAPVTPLGPLTVAWCAATRLTASGRVLGPAQRIAAEEAIRAVTLGAAATLHLDDEVGSLETGKKADFAILAEDPLAVPVEAMRDVEVLGTVSGGRMFLA
ncbi:MAG: amidohydrolase [Pseudomonadota bacterium]